MSAIVRGNRVLTFAVLTVAVASFTMLHSLIVPVLAVLETAYDTDQATASWVLTAFLLSASVSTPLVGRLGDAVGKQRMLVVTLGLLMVGSLLAALAPSIGWLILARVVQGAGGGVLPLAFGIVRDELGDRSAAGISTLASLGAVGFGAGIVIAGPIMAALSYHWLFWLPMIVTAVAAFAALVFIPESPVRTPGRLPVVPAVLLSAWLVGGLLGVSQGNQWGWTSPQVLGLLIASVLTFAGWLRCEMRVSVPLIDLQMMRRRGVWTANAVTGFVGFGMLAAFAFLPQLLQTPTSTGYGFGASVTESGWLMLPTSVATFVMGVLTARLMRLFGARPVVMTGTIMCVIAYVSIAFFHDTTAQLYAAVIVQGVGCGLVFSSIASVVISSVPPEQSGVASGMNANVRTIGGSVGTAVMAGIVTARTGDDGFPVEIGYQAGFLVLGVVTLGAVAAAVMIPDLRRGTARNHGSADLRPGQPARRSRDLVQGNEPAG